MKKRNVVLLVAMTAAVLSLGGCRKKKSNKTSNPETPPSVTPDPTPTPTPDPTPTPTPNPNPGGEVEVPGEDDDLNTIAGVSASNKSVVYNGQENTIVPQGDIPLGVNLTYEYRNSKGETVTQCVNAGTYTVKITLSGDGYKTLVLPDVTLTIEKATIEGLELTAKEYDYDGSSFTNIIEEVPSYLSVEYEYFDSSNNKVNSVINPGNYTVKATITGANYETKILNSTITVNKAKYLTKSSDIGFRSYSVSYDGNPHSISVNLPDKVNGNIEYRDNSGNLINASDIINPGEYMAILHLDSDFYEFDSEFNSEVIVTYVTEDENHNFIEPYVDFQGYINPIIITINKINLVDYTISPQSYVYDGVAKAFDTSKIEGFDANVISYYRDEELTDSVAIEDVLRGRYYVKISLENDIYNRIELVAILDINKTDESYHDVTIMYNNEIISIIPIAPNGSLNKSVIDTLDLPALSDGSTYSWDYDGDSILNITTDVTVNITISKAKYSINFVDMENNVLLTKSASKGEAITIDPYFVDGLYVSSWDYNGLEYKQNATFTLREGNDVTFKVHSYEIIDTRFSFEVKEGNAYVTGFDGEGNVTLPLNAVVDNELYDVVGVNPGALRNSSINELTIPNGITYIGEEAFANSKDLFVLYTPSSIKSINISGNAFSGCDYLVEVIYDTTIPSNLESYGIDISRVKSTHKVNKDGELLKYTKYNGDYVWYVASENNPILIKVCKALEVVTLPENYNNNGYSIDANAINSDIVKKIVVPNSVTYIEYKAFVVPNIQEIELPFTGFSATEEDVAACMLIIFGAGEEVVLTDYENFILYRPLNLKKVTLHSAEKEYSFYMMNKEELEIIIDIK